MHTTHIKPALAEAWSLVHGSKMAFFLNFLGSLGSVIAAAIVGLAINYFSQNTALTLIIAIPLLMILIIPWFCNYVMMGVERTKNSNGNPAVERTRKLQTYGFKFFKIKPILRVLATSFITALFLFPAFLLLIGGPLYLMTTVFPYTAQELVAIIHGDLHTPSAMFQNFIFQTSLLLLFSALYCFFCLAIPVLLDQQASPLVAVKESFLRVKANWLTVFIIYFIGFFALQTVMDLVTILFAAAIPAAKDITTALIAALHIILTLWFIPFSFMTLGILYRMTSDSGN